jgi:hypothetical protein
LKLAIVIVVYNGREYVGDCLAAIRASEYQPRTVVCVDNASTDGSAEFIATHYTDVVLVRLRDNTGFTGGVNAGVDHALATGHDAVLLINPDTVLPPTALSAMVAASERHPRGILAPRVSLLRRPHESGTYAGEIMWWCGRVRRTTEALPPGDSVDHPISTASGCALLIPRQVFDVVGLLDMAYFLYFEDADFLERALARGFEVWYVPSAEVLHRESAATGGRQSPLALYYFVRNRHYFVRKHRQGRPVYLVFLCYGLVDTCARALVHGLLGRRELARAVIRGALDGWSGRSGRTQAFERPAGEQTHASKRLHDKNSAA